MWGKFFKKLFFSFLTCIATLGVIWSLFVAYKVISRHELPVLKTATDTVRYGFCSISHKEEDCAETFQYGKKFVLLYAQEVKKEFLLTKEFLKRLWEE